MDKRIALLKAKHAGAGFPRFFDRCYGMSQLGIVGLVRTLDHDPEVIAEHGVELIRASPPHMREMRIQAHFGLMRP